MKRSFKFWFGFLAVALVIFGLRQTLQPVSAAITALSSPQSVNVGSNATVAFSAGDDLGITASQVTAQIQFGPGTFISGQFSAGTGGDACPGVISNGGLTVTFSAACINGIDSDAVSQAQPGSVTLTCNSAGTVIVTLQQNDGSQSQSTSVTCATGTTTTGGGCLSLTTPTAGGSSARCGVVSVTANPNILPCSGGSSQIKAQVLDVSGNPIANIGFSFSTSAGLLSNTSTTAGTTTLSLLPGQGTTATVTGSALSVDASGNPSVVTGTVVVSLGCNNFVAVVLTAAPNVIPCGGQSVVTAAGRDANGHVVPGLGFHFTTDHGGLLVGPPVHATVEQDSVVVSILPNMVNDVPSIIVHATVGTTKGDVSGDITIENACPKDTKTPGSIRLLPSAATASCGVPLFIAAVLKDSKGLPVDDSTVVKFIATHGKLTVDNLVDTTPTPGTPTPSTVASTVNATPVNGSMNIIFTPDLNFAGTARITAAAGASFTPLDIVVTCGNVAPSGVAGATGGTSGAARTCTSIGDNVCISPPNTGEVGIARISPPNTGTGGLR